MTLWPRLAMNRAFSPVPHPASRIDPVTRSATSMSAFYGLPMSQGAWPFYAESQVLRSGTGMAFVPLRVIVGRDDPSLW